MSPLGILVTLGGGLILGGAWGYLIGLSSKRPPKPRKHAHDWGRWKKTQEIRVSRGGTPESDLMGWCYYYERGCETCGEEQHEMKETGNI